MSEHTPAPWFVTPFYAPYDDGPHSDMPVCWRVTSSGEWTEEGDFRLDIQIDTSEADARLIAAAPEMLEALEDAVEWIEDDRFDDDYITEDWYHDARAAIAKARGTE